MEAQDGVTGSTLELYREAIGLRSRYLVGTAEFGWVAAEGEVLVFDRGEVTVVVNFGADPVPLPHGEILITSIPADDGLLPSDGAAWLRPS